jgi:hypothetical protein
VRATAAPLVALSSRPPTLPRACRPHRVDPLSHPAAMPTGWCGGRQRRARHRRVSYVARRPERLLPRDGRALRRPESPSRAGKPGISRAGNRKVVGGYYAGAGATRGDRLPASGRRPRPLGGADERPRWEQSMSKDRVGSEQPVERPLGWRGRNGGRNLELRPPVPPRAGMPAAPAQAWRAGHAEALGPAGWPHYMRV